MPSKCSQCVKYADIFVIKDIQKFHWLPWALTFYILLRMDLDFFIKQVKIMKTVANSVIV